MAYDRKIPVHIAYPMRLTLHLIQQKWKGCIINILRSGEEMRLNEIHRRLHMADSRVVNLQIKSMLADGLLTRRQDGGKMPKAYYSLSERGLSLVPVIDTLIEWGEIHKDEFLNPGEREGL